MKNSKRITEEILIAKFKGYHHTKQFCSEQRHFPIVVGAEKNMTTFFVFFN